MIQTQLGSRQSQHTRMPDAAALATLIDIQQISLMETASNALAEVAVLTVPRLADICIIGTSDQLASFSYTIAHRDPAQRTTLHQTISTMTAGIAHTTNDHNPHEWYGLVNHHGQYSQAISPLIDCILQHFPNYSFILIDIETTLVQSSFVIFLSQPDEPHYTANDLNLAQSIAASCVRIFESENMRLTAQRHARAVSEQSALLNTLISDAPIGVAFVDTELRYRYINRRLAALNRRSVEEHFGLTPRELFPELADRVEANFRHVLTTGQPMVRINLSNDSQSTHFPKRSWLVSYYPVRTTDGQLLGVGSLIEEITELQATTEALNQTNAELSRALKLKDEFMAMMSHELRTPLNAMLSIGEVIFEGVYGPITTRQQQALSILIERGHHLSSVLADILELAHLETGNVVLHLRPTSLEQICQRVLTTIEPLAQHKEVSLQTINCSSSVTIYADPDRLVKAINNLLDNAIKFTPKHGTVGLELIVDSELQHVLLTVWDTGIGIAPEDQSHLFKPFTQIDGSLSRNHQGIGIGLVMANHLIKLHHGNISWESTPGIGSRFTIRLPYIPKP